MAMTGRYFPFIFFLILSVLACKADEKPVEQKKPEPVVIIKQKHPVLSPDQRRELGFPPDLIAQIELAASAEAEPFYATVVAHSENLKGEKEFEQKKLAGFSVRTKNTDEIIISSRAALLARGYLIFKSHRGYGSLPDMVTVVKGRNSYDLLKMQGTEAQGYQISTQEIILWLKERQHDAPFVLTGAGADWLEARFIKPPRNTRLFAKKAAAFAPDVLSRGMETVDKLAESMEQTNGFYLVWD